ncbi:MAG TPA: phenylalanine--tRNA ligase subunit beta [Woeseiaceae bacterium]|nr:phenylalanine--tRNA ligase subunit beta [Woeseiaceae bacterium]
MKFPLSWLREWVDPGLPAEALAERLTMAGLEVKAIEVEGEALSGVVVGEVLSVERHPNADRLHLCRVSDGENEIQVVCGAPNLTVGMKSPLALPGVRLPNGVKLRRSRIRGVESNGMLCSARELGLGEDAGGIVRLPDDAPTGADLAGWLGLPDTVLDIDLTPNRGDCFSVLGIARDVAALTGAALKSVEVTPVAPMTDDVHPVTVADPNVCPRFAGRVVRDIDPNAVTPLWMSERLRRSGLRPIHPVVDVTNYVMLELGQPLHAYDLDRVAGPIRPRFASAGEKLTLLDGREAAPGTDTIVIGDDSGPIGLAGIMGGESTAVTPGTRNVFFEAAFWPPALMAGRARALGLHTDASLRFERGVDPGGQARAIERATGLLVAIAGGRPGPLVDLVAEDTLPRRADIRLRRSRLARVLGTDLDPGEVSGCLERLGLGVERDGDGWRVTVPSHRFDLEIEDDLVEEVARVHGYDRLPEITETGRYPVPPLSEQRPDPRRIADALIARDYQEVVTWSFIDPATDRRFTGRDPELVLENPISAEMSVMRGSLWPGLLRAAAANLARQQERVRLFEIGKSYHGNAAGPIEIVRLAAVAVGPLWPEQWGADTRSADFFDIKADLEALFAFAGATGVAFEATGHPVLQPGQAAEVRRGGERVGTIGKLHPAVARELDIAGDVLLFEVDLEAAFSAEVPRARPVSRFPAIRRDIAVVVPEEVPAAQVVEVASAAAPDIIRRAFIFDVYRGPGIEAGRKSVALGLILQETSRTLTDAEADSARAAAVERLEQQLAATVRE